MNGLLDEWTQKPSSVFVFSGGLEYSPIIIHVYHFFWLNVVMNIPYLEHMGICVNQTDMETPAVHLCHSPFMATLVVCQMSEISHDLTFIVISSIGAPRA